MSKFNKGDQVKILFGINKDKLGVVREQMNKAFAQPMEFYVVYVGFLCIEDCTEITILRDKDMVKLRELNQLKIDIWKDLKEK